MATKSRIEWTEATWNPVTGCTAISAGCDNCYAERMARRLKAMGNPRYANGFQVTMHEDKLDEPLKWKKPLTVFVNSMSDLFHENVSEDFVRRIFLTMTQAHWHTFQVLTKRPRRLAAIRSRLPWADNIWIGTSVESEQYSWRVDMLRNVPSAVRFLSLEPLLGPIPNLDLRGIDWAIVGGESGPGARPIQEEWVTEIQRQCESAGTAFFFKQWGGTNKKATGRELDGQVWDAMPLPSPERLAGRRLADSVPSQTKVPRLRTAGIPI